MRKGRVLQIEGTNSMSKTTRNEACDLLTAVNTLATQILVGHKSGEARPQYCGNIHRGTMLQ